MPKVQHSQFGSSIETVEPTLFKNNMYTLCAIQLYWTRKTTVKNTQVLICAMFTYTYPKNNPCVLLIPYMEHVECHVPTMLGSNTLHHQFPRALFVDCMQVVRSGL